MPARRKPSGVILAVIIGASMITATGCHAFRSVSNWNPTAGPTVNEHPTGLFTPPNMPPSHSPAHS